MKIRICDDVDDIAEGWVAAVKEVAPDGCDIARMGNAKEEISNLLSRKLAVEAGGDPIATPAEFDGLDVLVVDYDLLHLDEAGGRTTGEGVARLARTFSTCGAIVVMNQYKGPQFDLGMRGHLDSFADTNIDAAMVGQPALWERLEPQAARFNPTTWTPLPDLLAAARDLAKRIAAQGQDAVLMPLLGLDAAALTELSDTAFGFLNLKAQTAEELATVTVRDFVERSFDIKIAEALLVRIPDIAFNLVAFRLAKWLDRAVLRPMDVLVDGPHLLDRLPFMIDGDKVDANDPDVWARAAAAPEETTRWDVLKQYLNESASAVLGRTVFDWFRLANDETIDEMQDKYLETQRVRYYLAEDTSRFVDKANLTRFRADFHNFGDRRAVERLDDVTYGPLRRIRFG